MSDEKDQHANYAGPSLLFLGSRLYSKRPRSVQISETERRRFFTLEVPLSASGVEGFWAVKVIARDGNGLLLAQTIRFDARRRGTATFTFARNPGPLRVDVVPSDAP
jgi:hypothetical protein